MSIKARIAALAAASLLSAAGVAHIKLSEGRHTTAYPDPATGGAPWTICYGHTGPEVKPGLKVSLDQCELWLLEDTAKAERAVKRLTKVPLRQGQYDSAVSFVFNLGEGNYASSTLLRLQNAGQWNAACDQYPRWKYANKRVLEGLVTRRYKEQTMCRQEGPYVYRP